MLELKNVKKSYVVGDIETKALDDISLAFREKEFVAILGKSGSGKTTCLNIIGGLDRYDSGEMRIKGKYTSKFKDRDWDAYRNNSVGFVFQSYNLIMHLGIVANVELAMTLSGVSSAEKHKRAVDALERVGLKEHLHKKPNQLSGGQMQRVAIARALANDPEILLCDEPTGALDTVTSEQIMDLIKSLSADRLVIVVTHNPELADKYADRIIKFEDGKVTSDTHPHAERPKDDEFKLKKTSMNFFTALRLSFNNLLTKKGRTFLTAFASSIGIIGIAVILSLSNGFKIQVDDFQRDALAEFPIIITQSSAAVDEDALTQVRAERSERGLNKEGAREDVVYLYDPSATRVMHTNVFTDEYMAYLKNISPDICASVGYTRIVNMNLLRQKPNGDVISVSFNGNGITGVSDGGMGGMSGGFAGGISSMGLSSYPVNLDKTKPTYIEKNYTLLAGSFPEDVTDIALIIDAKNCLDFKVMANLGFDVDGKEFLDFNDIIGAEFEIVTNDNYYEKTDFGTFLPRADNEEMFGEQGNIKVRVSCIARREDSASSTGLLGLGVAYSDGLAELVIQSGENSEIVKAQRESDKNVMTMADVDESAKEQFISYLGGGATPFMIMVYPNDFNSKNDVTAYLDAYNAAKTPAEAVVYTDLAATISSMTGNIMDAITVVLIAFAAVSLVVSLIMICIITYTSVLERTKEIGVLRALGARKKDISRVFDAETCILGIFSGVLGVCIAYLLTIPTNVIIKNMTGLENVSRLPIIYAVSLVIVSTVLTMLGGHIPAKMASRKDAVEALRTGE